MLAIARKAAIRERLHEHKSVRITELAAELNVTKETIRRDLREMEQGGELIRTHGGAYILDGVQNDIDVGTRQVLKIPEKERIAQKCDSIIQSGDYIVSFNGEEVTTLSELNYAKDQCKVGDTVNVGLVRNGKEITVDLVLKDANQLDT